MCGRYVTPEVAEAERNLLVHWLEYERCFNVAPSQRVPVVRMQGGEREALQMRWGLVPYFARGVPPRYSTINARVENLTTGACWRTPWQRAQRCVLPATGFYEWQLPPEGGAKRPYFIHPTDRSVVALAGLWDLSRAADGQETLSCTIVTLPASPLVSHIHAREPAMLAPTDIERWLAGSLEEARAALRPYPDEHLQAYPVGTRVNSPRNNEPSLLEPLGVGTALAG